MMKLKLPVSCPLFKYDYETFLCFTSEEAVKPKLFSSFCFRKHSTVSSLPEEMLILHGDQFELKWDAKNRLN